MDIREQVACITCVYSGICLLLGGHNPIAEGNVCSSKLQKADKILALGLVEIDPDQTLPECPIVPDPRTVDFEFQLAEKAGYRQAQQDYKAQGWRKVVEK